MYVVFWEVDPETFVQYLQGPYSAKFWNAILNLAGALDQINRPDRSLQNVMFGIIRPKQYPSIDLPNYYIIVRKLCM